jgi:hypothetical protein
MILAMLPGPPGLKLGASTPCVRVGILRENCEGR